MMTSTMEKISREGGGEFRNGFIEEVNLKQKPEKGEESEPGRCPCEYKYNSNDSSQQFYLYIVPSTVLSILTQS